MTGKPIGQKGFSLIEMMVVVAVIGILAAIAYPSYARYIERGHLTDAYAELVDINNAIKTERVRTPGALSAQADLQREASERFREPGLAARYDITVAMPNATSSRYNLVVTPKANSGYTLALWMNSIGEAYRCQDAASAKAYNTTGKCERIGGGK
ncbi:PilX family type IV pilin [Neisseria sp.]|uniref:PilX family type IV pilin n=1 Tax=Neisseria sp. TaxID=192066 RepID=UPI0026DDB05B|nr:PilX family type IV pilin [Neisseria sp.]MDO4906987.1 PilX family type IV pilin [Neisseria sp.]